MTYKAGLFSDTLQQVLKESAPVEYAFLDGHHQHRPTLEYFDTICGRAADTALFVFDDISWSRGMRRAWGDVKADRRTAVAADFGTMGVCVTSKGQHGRGKHVTKPILLL